ncbi:MAG: ribonuclease P protein component [Minisyncoccota bacterium]
MFSRRERLPRADFPLALKAGQRLSSAHFTAILPPKSTGYAVIVSKKAARLSVTRHRIKRQVLHALRTLTPPKSLILFPKPSALHLDYQHIKEDLAVLLSKIH